MNDDESIDIQVRPARELLGRATLLTALGRRGLIEEAVEDDLISAETDQFDLQAWARVELAFWMSPADLHVLQAPVGSLIPEEADYCAEALLSASTIAWCMGVLQRDLPLLSDHESEREAMEWAPRPWSRLRGREKTVRIRGEEVLARERERWELVVWRLSLFVDPESREEDDAALRDVGAEIQIVGLIDWVDGDFALEDETPFHAFTNDQRAQLDAEATVRLQALNWVCGFGESWEEVPLFPD